LFQIALLVLPVFALITIGYLARATHVLRDRASDGLSDFVFVIAIPALIFRTLTSAALPAAQPWGYWIAYFTGAGIVWGAAMLVARLLQEKQPLVRVVSGFSAAQSNTVLVGIPIILEAFGDEGAVPLFLLIAIHLPVMVFTATLLTDGRGADLGQVVRKLSHNPIIIGILLGAMARLIGYQPAGVIKTVLDQLASASVPCALIAMGLALHRYGLESGLKLPTMVTFLKLIVHPALVYWLSTRVFSMPPAWSGVATLFAACPTGVNAYLFAARYQQGEAIASSSIALSTLFSAVTLMGWLWILGVKG
jgi:malonate transporter and related proteins